MPALQAIFLVFLLAAFGSATGGKVDAEQAVPPMALYGKEGFDRVAHEMSRIEDGMSAETQNNPLQFSTLTDFWCAWELTDRPRKPALLIDDMQIEYEPYIRGIVAPTQQLIAAFRKAKLPIFWSTWWRWGPHDGFFNTMDRFYGPVGWRTAANALYNHNLTNGGDVLAAVAPVTEEERKRVMHKSYSLDMFDEHPMQWLVPSRQGTLHQELQKLGVDTVVQVGAWTDDCIISTAFHAFSLQYDVVLVEDAVSTASKQHFNAIEVLRGAAAKVLLAAEVAQYIDEGLRVETSVLNKKRAQKLVGGRAVRSRAHGQVPVQEPVALMARANQQSEGPALVQFFALLSFGPFCFCAGWFARGQALKGKASVPLLS